VLLEEMPLNLSDKVDERRLLELYTSRDRTTEKEQYTPPNSETEIILAEIWKKILNRENIDIHQNFFVIGGHSLLATRVMTSIRKEMRVSLSVGDLFRKPTIAELAELVDTKKNLSPTPPITVEKRPALIPLSYTQERMWFIDRLQGSINYHIPAVVRIKGPVDIQSLEKAFRSILERHEALRTVFREVEDIPYQFVLPMEEWVPEYITIQDDSGFTDDFINAAINKPFDLSRDCMLRVAIGKTMDHDHLLVLTMHHIASDGWSASILVNELVEYYRAGLEKRAPALPALKVQYADYCIWQKTYMAQEIDKKLQYWKKQLEGTAQLNLPIQYKRPTYQSGKGALVNARINQEITLRLNELSKKENVTLFVTLLSVFKVLLYRYSRESDICVGSPVANRIAKETEPLIGCFINTLPLRSKLEDTMSFRELLYQLRETTVQAYSHQDVPLEKIIDSVVTERHTDRNTLFQVLFSLDNNEAPSTIAIESLSFSAVPFKPATSKFDFGINITGTPEGLHFDISYSTDLFSQEFIQRLSGHFMELIRSVIIDPGQQIGGMNMVTNMEADQIKSLYSTLPVSLPAGGDIVSLFRKQVNEHAQHTALVYGDQSMTYAQLYKRAFTLASVLKQKVGERNKPVPVCMENPLGMVTAMMGILMAGCAYVPLDPADQLTERVSYVLTDCDATVIVTDNHFNSALSGIPEKNIIRIDILEEVSDDPGTPDLFSPSPGDLAYIIYTSGSSGRPKGVMVTHGNLSDYFGGLFARTGIGEYASFGLMSTLTADLGKTVLFGSLLSGGVLHLFSRESLSDAVFLHKYFSQNRIDCIKIVPSHWKVLDTGKPLLPQKLIVFGGEELTTDITERIEAFYPGLRIINHYGPTETTIGKLLYEVPSGKQLYKIPVGRPFSNTQLYVLDQRLQLCPLGVPGELFISSDGVAAGYVNNNSLTAEKFLEDPFRKGYRMYRTGDRVVQLDDGNIVFHGRADNQVKIRGYRIEPDEISFVLSEMPSVRQAVVMAFTEKEPACLVAFFVADEDISNDSIQSYLKKRLPAYMIPSVFIKMDRIPVTSNGKTDRKALSLIERPVLSMRTYIAPVTETERLVCDLWSGYLGSVQVGLGDNFFDLGGHSLLAAR
ncbi:MAG: amino acid adenylation domain-containing protein, partial [Bacteroidetes bacterium]|nr:amino acid adenylation domain-containing protein [Bacteroidota bacterium]